MNSKDLETPIKIVSAVLCICLVFVAILCLDSIFGVQDGGALSIKDIKTKIFGGDPYTKKTTVNYLIIGSDNYEYEEKPESSGWNYNDHLADVLMILSVDKDTQSYTLVQIDRDTMSPINILGLSGSKVGEEVVPIARAHNYGDGLETSSINTVNAVSRLFYNINIDFYIDMTMTAVAKLNDCLGGVTLTLDETQDYSSLNETWVPGATITLNGQDAFRFIQARMTVDDGTNISRMARQRQYLTALLSKSDAFKSFSYAQLKTLFGEISPYMVTNCNVDDINEMFELFGEYDYNGIVVPDGEKGVYTEQISATETAEYNAFYVTSDTIEAVLKKVFYKPYV